MDGERTYFLYADEGLIAEYDDTGHEIRSYGWQPDSTWTTNPVWLKEGGEYYWYQNDHLGTPQKLIDIDGTVVWAARYTAFGEAQIQVEEVTNNLRFPGQYADDETGLHYNWFRYYHTSIGRYLTPDPIGFEGGDKNFYVYVRNDPVNWVDPWGLDYMNPEDAPNVWVLITDDHFGNVWFRVPPCGILHGETDAVVLNCDEKGNCTAYKWIDCYDAIGRCDKKGRMKKPKLVHVGTKHTTGKEESRQAVCESPIKSFGGQTLKGGKKNTKDEFHENPPMEDSWPILPFEP